MKASMYIIAETSATDRASTSTPAPLNSSVAPNDAVPTAAHHSRIRAAPPRCRASNASSTAAIISTAKNSSTTGHTTWAGSGRSSRMTGTVEPIQPANAPQIIQDGTGRNRLTSRNVKNG
jgi:hypothetical protein